MIETEPAFLHFFGQPGKPLVDRGPFSEMLQSGRTPLFERFFQMEPAFVIYVVIESYVALGGGETTSSVPIDSEASINTLTA